MSTTDLSRNTLFTRSIASRSVIPVRLEELPRPFAVRAFIRPYSQFAPQALLKEPRSQLRVTRVKLARQVRG